MMDSSRECEMADNKLQSETNSGRSRFQVLPLLCGRICLIGYPNVFVRLLLPKETWFSAE